MLTHRGRTATGGIGDPDARALVTVRRFDPRSGGLIDANQRAGSCASDLSKRRPCIVSALRRARRNSDYVQLSQPPGGVRQSHPSCIVCGPSAGISAKRLTSTARPRPKVRSHRQSQRDRPNVAARRGLALVGAEPSGTPSGGVDRERAAGAAMWTAGVAGQPRALFPREPYPDLPAFGSSHPG